jgi:uncharacterized protein (TIGR02246 family)
MRMLASLGLGIVLVSAVVPAGAQSPSNKPESGPSPKASADPSRTARADLAAIRQTSLDFEAAFNNGDASAVAAHWTEDGDYRAETGQVFSGRPAIESEYREFFAAHKGQRIKIVIDSLRLLSDCAAIEDGRAMLDPPPAGAPAISTYTAVHVKVNGKWLMSTVRDARVETPSTYRKLEDLEWLIGTWIAEEHGSRTESVCRWVANKSFVERTYTVTHPDHMTTSGVQLIGFNPQGGHLQSWNFSSDGSYAVGVWSPRENGWSAELQGTLADGQNTTATNLLTRLDDNAYTWQSIHRTVGDESLPDTDEVVIKRQVK